MVNDSMDSSLFKMPEHATTRTIGSGIVEEKEGDLFEAPENAVLIRELLHQQTRPSYW